MTIIVFFLILGLLIFVHEFGHFIFARLSGVYVAEFGFGFPPRVFGIRKKKEKKGWEIVFGPDKKMDVKEEDKEKKEEIIDTEKPTLYSLNWILWGGFVKIFGEQGEEKENKKSLASKKIRERFLVLFAGILMNFVLGAFLIFSGYVAGLPAAETPENKTLIQNVDLQIIGVAKNSPAEEAGIKEGMKILEAKILSGESEKFLGVEQFQNFIKKHQGEEIVLKLKYNESELDKKIIPRLEPPENEGPLGVVLAKVGILKYPFYKAFYYGFRDTIYLIGAIFEGLYVLLKQLILSGTLAFDVAGPVGIAKMTGKMVDLGFIYVLQFAALLSINLGVINFLPFPALDGGRLLFLLIEKIKGSPVPQKFENYVHAVGFTFLILLMILVTVRDIIRW